MERSWMRRSAAPPPTSSLPFVVYPRIGQPLNLILLDPLLAGVLVHWDGERGANVPCWRDPCPWCDAGVRRRWVGFTAAESADTGRPVVAMISAGAARQLLPHCEPLPVGYRGLCVSLYRGKSHRASRVEVAVSDRIEEESLRPSFDFGERLETLFGLDRAAWDTDVPVPEADEPEGGV